VKAKMKKITLLRQEKNKSVKIGKKVYETT
jgi:hypothetical protein